MSFIEMVNRRLRNYADEVKGYQEAIPVLRAEQNWRHMVAIIHSISRRVLSWGMLQANNDGDLEAAIKTFNISNQYSPELVDMIEMGDKFPQRTSTEVQNNWELASDFTFPIYCSLLSGNMPLARRLAIAVETIKLPQEPGWFDVTAHLLAAFVLDKKTLFDEIWPLYEKLNLYHGQKILDAYMQLYKLVLNKNAAEYTRLLKKVSEDFHLRAKDKKLEDFGEFGGPVENAFVLDFMALGIAFVAHQRGMSNDIDTEFFPQRLHKMQCGL